MPQPESTPLGSAQPRTPAGESSRERARLQIVVRGVCSCSGRDDEPHPCQACLVWRLMEGLSAMDRLRESAA